MTPDHRYPSDSFDPATPSWRTGPNDLSAIKGSGLRARGAKIVLIVFPVLLVLVLIGAVRPGWAMRPMSQLIETIAGEGDGSYIDGAYWRATFDHPLGVSVDPTGTKLCVADSQNHVIRLIDLNDNNRVTTLAGTGRPGFTDGPLLRSAFNHPSLVAWIDGHRILVRDEGNRIFRLVDLTRQTVTTLGGLPGKIPDLYVNNVQLMVWNMAYLPSTQAVYFSQPEIGSLKKIDPRDGSVTTVLQGDPLAPHLNALCVFKGNLWVGDRDGGNVCRVQGLGGAAVTLVPEGKAIGPYALVGLSDEILALLPGWDQWCRAYPPGDFKLTGFNGMPIGDDPDHFTGLVEAADGLPLGLAASPVEPNRVFLALPKLNRILSIREYHQDQYRDVRNKPVSGLNDYDYPAVKSPGTFRILVIGNSYSYYLSYDDLRRRGELDGRLRAENMPKKLDLLLNMEASWRGSPTRFEVFHYGFPGDEPLFLWPYYDVPDVVKKYDVDLVVEIMAPEVINTAAVYYQRPIGPNGLPARTADNAYLMQPADRKIPPGIPRAYFEYLKGKDLARVTSDGQVQLDELDHVMADPTARELLFKLFSPAICGLTQKLASMRTKAGRPVRYQMFFIPGRNKGTATREEYREFWKKIAVKAAFPFQDLTQPFVTLSGSFWPVDETKDSRHFTATGHSLFAYILAHELMDLHLVNLGPSPK